MKAYNKATKQETTKLQSQLNNSNMKHNLRKVERCGSYRFKEDREATSVSVYGYRCGSRCRLQRDDVASASTSASALYLCLRLRLRCVRALSSPKALHFPLHRNMLMFEFHLILCPVFLIFLFCFQFYLILLFSFPNQIVLSCVL